MVKRLLIVFGLLFVLPQATQGQCTPTTILFENFDGAVPIVGAQVANIYGNGQWNNAAYALSGSTHGWFNVINGLGNVDVYNRHLTGFCVGQPVDVSLWTRESYGGTNVTISVEDDFGIVLASQTLTLTATFQQITFNFPATTAGLNMIIHCNSVGGNGIDIVVEDILITSCVGASQNINFTDCSGQTVTDLFSLFAAGLANTGVWSGPSALNNGYLGSFDPSVHLSGTYTYTDAANCSVSTVMVSAPPPVNFGPDTTICSGATLTLNAGAGFDFYDWSTGSTNASITVATAGTYDVAAGTIMDNVVLNGDFEGGTTNVANNFTTSYVPGTGGAWGLLSAPGQYAITTSPNLVHNNFVPCGDITTGTSNMLVANGSSFANTIVWSQTVPISTNTDYLFSFWATNVVNDPNISNLQLYVNGVAIGPVNATTPVGCNWNQISDSWNSGANTTAVLSIVNQSIAGGGNDFAIDEISFAPICMSYDTIVVSTETLVQTITVVDPLCAGDANGEIHISTPLAIEYSIDNGVNWQPDTFFLNLPAANYTVCSRSAAGCTSCNTVSLINPAPVTVIASPDITICENGSTTISAVAANGVTFDYHWDFTADLSASQTVAPTTTTTYYVYAENENGCLSALDSVIVDLYPPLDGTISGITSICPGFDAQLDATATGGMGAPYTFTWSTGTVETTNGASSITTQPAATTNYTVTIEDGCTSTPVVLTTTVNIASLPVPSLFVDNNNQCEPAIFEVSYSGDLTLVETIDWVVNNEEFHYDQFTIESGPWMAGNYPIELIVTTTDGCVVTAYFDNALHVDPIPVANFTYSPNPPQMFNTAVHFTNGSVGATTYQWTFEAGTPTTSTQQNPMTTFPDGVTGNYWVTLIATSEFGCSDTMQLQIPVVPEIILYVPNTFTPDGDEFNQTWNIFIEGVDRHQFTLTLWNRWGEKIWESTDPDLGWDATFKGKEVPEGTYNWQIRTRNILNDEKLEFGGHVNVIR